MQAAYQKIGFKRSGNEDSYYNNPIYKFSLDD